MKKINPKLTVDQCWEMVNRIETLEQAKIAIKWLVANERIDNEQFDDLMRAVSYKMRDFYRNA